MTKLMVVIDDITTQKVDAIVNASNRSLLGGGGVDGAIHRVAGPKLREECMALGGCQTGEVKITKAYNLPAKYVIHTVGPEYGREKGMESELLTLCYLTTLKLAEEHGVKTIAFPAISVGAFRYPPKEATEVAIAAVKQYLSKNDAVFDEIRFVAYNDEVYNEYARYLL